MSAPQGTPEWLQERLGHVTASRMADVLATVKNGEAASRANYRAELIAQRLTGQIEDGYTNGAMAWGTEHEPIARATYEIRCGVTVHEVGFVKHPDIQWAGASPDGIVGASEPGLTGDGLVEIKCPNTATHIDYLLKREVPPKYQPQMLWQMACTGRAWCDFVSFDPRMPARMQLFVIRFMRDDARIEAMEEEVRKFLGEVQSTVDRLEAIVQAGNAEPLQP